MKNNSRYVSMLRGGLGFLFLFLFVISSASLLNGCGWRLRGSITLPPEMNKTHIQGVAPYSDLGVQLTNTLTGSGAQVVSDAGLASASLVIVTNKMDRRVLAIDNSGQASEYELNYLLQFKVLGEKGKVLVPEQKVTATRDYRFDPNAILAKSDEEAKLRKDMIRFAVQQMFFRINASLRTAGKSAQ